MLDFAGEVCPRCVNKGAVMARMWELMLPYKKQAATMMVLLLVGIGLDLGRLMAARDQALLDFLVILDDPVVDEHDVARAMRVRVLRRGLAMGRPAGVTDPAGGVAKAVGRGAQDLLDPLELALLVVGAQQVADDIGSEPALRRDRKIIL